MHHLLFNSGNVFELFFKNKEIKLVTLFLVRNKIAWIINPKNL